MVKLLRGMDASARMMMVLTAFCAFGASFFIFIEISARFLGLKFYGTAEYIRNLLIVIVFLQLPFAVRTRSMLAVDIMVGALPKAISDRIGILGAVLGAFFFFAVGLGAFEPAISAWVNNEMEGESVVDVPAWPGRFSVVIGCWMASLYYVLRVIELAVDPVWARYDDPTLPPQQHI
jgi:TRAP-type C4-dicarboxylate transport system permease small subunit